MGRKGRPQALHCAAMPLPGALGVASRRDRQTEHSQSARFPPEPVDDQRRPIARRQRLRRSGALFRATPNGSTTANDPAQYEQRYIEIAPFDACETLGSPPRSMRRSSPSTSVALRELEKRRPRRRDARLSSDAGASAGSAAMPASTRERRWGVGRGRADTAPVVVEEQLLSTSAPAAPPYVEDELNRQSICYVKCPPHRARNQATGASADLLAACRRVSGHLGAARPASDRVRVTSRAVRAPGRQSRRTSH